MIIVGLLVGLVVLIGLGVLGLGLMVLWGSAQNVWQRWTAFVGALRSRGWAETEGTIVRSVVVHRRTRRQVQYEPAIRYTYWVGGKQLSGERRNFDELDGGSYETARAAVERLPIGSKQRVYHDPAVPRRATLARDAPPVFWLSLGWLVVACIGVVLAGLGGDIVVGAFAEPPELGELPTLRAQLGGLLVGVGALALLCAGIRALLERKTRALLRCAASAKTVRVGDVRQGERVAIFGRAEAMVESDGDELDLLFGERPLLYLHSDLGSPDHKLTRVSPFVVRDETGDVEVDLSDGHGMLGKQRVAIQGEVEQWLDRHELELGSSVSGDRRANMNVERIHEGDSILIVGQALENGGSDLVLGGRELLFADRPLPQVIEGLRTKPLTTLGLAWAGMLSMLIGMVALLS